MTRSQRIARAINLLQKLGYTVTQQANPPPPPASVDPSTTAARPTNKAGK